MKKRLEQGVLEPKRALHWLEQCMKRNESIQEYLDIESDEFGFDNKEQRRQNQQHNRAT
jgi:hypothetical protein